MGQKTSWQNRLGESTCIRIRKCDYFYFSLTFPNYPDNLCNQLSLNLGAWPITEMQTVDTSSDISEPQGDSKKLFICEQCNYSCKRAFNLKIHMRTHSGEKPFSCTLCKFSCALANTLKTHKRKHTGEKPYNCTQCNYSSAYFGSLQTHVLTHSEGKPFNCTHCNLNWHKLMHWSGQHASSTSTPSALICQQCSSVSFYAPRLNCVASE